MTTDLPVAAPERTPSWDYFPLVMCINLKDRQDRFAEAKQELARVGLTDVVFYQPERQKDREKSCLDSHMACLEYAVAQGVPHVLIFEDDVLFLDDYCAGMERVIKFLKEEPSWKFFHLGAFIFKKAKQYSEHILQGGFMCLHGYIVKTEHAVNILAERRYSTKASSDTFCTIINGDDAYVHINPLVCIQRASVSDGTWDPKNLSAEGWLGKAMMFTALRPEEEKTFTAFTRMQKSQVKQGVLFFKCYRVFKGWMQKWARRQGRDYTGVKGPGTYTKVNLTQTSASL